MSAKTKTLDNLQSKLIASMQVLGLGLMATAAVVGSIDLPDGDKKAAVVPVKPVLEFANDGGQNPLRREREETAPHFISYSEIQRTPGRTGRY